MSHLLHRAPLRTLTDCLSLQSLIHWHQGHYPLGLDNTRDELKPHSRVTANVGVKTMRTYPSALMIATVLVTLTLSGCVAPVPPSAIDDANMTNQIKTALMNEAVFKVNQIRVETINGVVTLTGVVQSRIEALHAAEMAKTIQGVREIRNGLEVQIQ